MQKTMEHKLVDTKVKLKYCEFCGKAALSTCSRCRSVYYCCKKHQYLDWLEHKKKCIKVESMPANINRANPETYSDRNANVSASSSPINLALAEEKRKMRQWCKKIINDLNSDGICVLDNFMGSIYGDQMMEEIRNLYKKVRFEKDQVRPFHPMFPYESDRTDIVKWINDCTRDNCIAILMLIRKIDYMVSVINKTPDRGCLSKYDLFKRTKFLIKHFPGNGSRHKLHADNPKKDGRCITLVYYINKNWEKKNGGVLKVYSLKEPSENLHIEPVLDRFVVFWSDQRVPHEVLPTSADRFSIITWYYDRYEYEEAKSRCTCQAANNV